MRQFYLAVFLFTCTQSMLNAHFCENSPEMDSIRVFIQPEEVQLTENGIYLDLEDGQKISLPNIHSNSRGLYTKLGNTDSVKYTTYTCPGCFVTYNWWQNCTTKGCPKNPRG